MSADPFTLAAVITEGLGAVCRPIWRGGNYEPAAPTYWRVDRTQGLSPRLATVYFVRFWDDRSFIYLTAFEAQRLAGLLGGTHAH